MEAGWGKYKKQRWEENKKALQENQTQLDHLTEMPTSGQMNAAILSNLSPLERGFNSSGLLRILSDFNRLRLNATPGELQRLLRWTVRHVDWQSDG